MKTIVLSSLAAALMGAASLAQAATTLTVYTALEADQLKAYQAAFEKKIPISRSSGYATPPASLPPNCWLKRTTQRLTPSGVWPAPHWV